MRFLDIDEIVETNKLTTVKHGGLHRLRDKNLLDSAINNPKNLYSYQNAYIYSLASSYAVSIIKNHPFLDGNKRTGLLSMDLFLRMNGKHFKFSRKETVEMMVKVATSEVKLKELSEWLRSLDL